VAKDLTERITAAVKALRPGVDVGPLTTARQRATVEAHVGAAKEGGGEVLAGGKAFGEGHGYEPTVVRVSSDDGPLMQEETFGPVIPIAEVEDVEEAIRRANASRFGLTASIWSRDTREAARLAHRLRAGVVTVNNHAFTGAIPAAPWSGAGETGWGITNSPLALDALTRPRLVLVDRAGAARELWWYPYTPTLRRIALAFARLRSGSILARLGAVFTLLIAVPRRLVGRDRGEA
jgi:acyl-CoA reductase-like NAD-dependent aldehyde dehydrogenase